MKTIDPEKAGSVLESKICPVHKKRPEIFINDEGKVKIRICCEQLKKIVQPELAVLLNEPTEVVKPKVKPKIKPRFRL